MAPEALALVRIASIASGEPARHELLGAAMGLARPPADGARAGGPDGIGQLRLAGALRKRAERDRVGQLGHGRDVAKRDQAGEAERVQPVARQQAEIDLAASATRGVP